MTDITRKPNAWLNHPAPGSAEHKGARISRAPDIGHRTGDVLLAEDHAAFVLNPAQRELFAMLYRDHFDFVFRNLRRMGVASSAVDDALQDVYLVALRRIADFREGTHPKAWLFAIAMRVAANHRRSERRRGDPVSLADEHLQSSHAGPFDLVALEQAKKIVGDFLDSLDDSRRTTFVLAELEQMSAPEIADALSANVNTVYSWLRMARADFAKWIARRSAAGGVHG